MAILVEEVLFRGIICGWLRRRLNVTFAAVLSGIIFTAVHHSVFATGIVAAFNIALQAILLTLLFELSRSLCPGIL